MAGNGETVATPWQIPDHLRKQVCPVILEMDPPKAIVLPVRPNRTGIPSASTAGIHRQIQFAIQPTLERTVV